MIGHKKHKKHKNENALEIHAAPMGAWQICGSWTGRICAFCGKKSGLQRPAADF
jgi:hypothetical protein